MVMYTFLNVNAELRQRETNQNISAPVTTKTICKLVTTSRMKGAMQQSKHKHGGNDTDIVSTTIIMRGIAQIQGACKEHDC